MACQGSLVVTSPRRLLVFPVATSMVLWLVLMLLLPHATHSFRLHAAATIICSYWGKIRQSPTSRWIRPHDGKLHAGLGTSLSVKSDDTMVEKSPGDEEETMAMVTSMSNGEPINNLDAVVLNNDGNKDARERCPFSRTFPRYRIYLSSDKRQFRQESASHNIFSGIMQKIHRAQVEHKYNAIVKDEKLGTRLRWVVCDDAPDASIKALAVFWREVSNLLASPLSEDNLGDDSPAIFVLSGVKTSVVVRILEIYRWFLDMQEGEQTLRLYVDAVMDEDMPVPLIVLRRRCSLKGATVNDACLPDHDAADGIAATWDDDVINKRIKLWVRRMLVNLGICPFTKSDTRSGQGLADLGVPVANIAYHSSMASPTHIPLLMADTWEAIEAMVAAGPAGKEGISSILLAAPRFDEDFALWSGPIFAMLEASVSAAEVESKIGVVCFHPHYRTPDGKSWPGFGHMHSVPRLRKWLDEFDAQVSNELTEEEVAAGGAWQRRTPHAVINILRAEQLAAAEGRRATGSLYTRNIKKLVGKVGIGSEKLAAELLQERELT